MLIYLSLKSTSGINGRRFKTEIGKSNVGGSVGGFLWAASMLVTKCVGDNLEMLVTVSAIFVSNIFYLLTLASGSNIQKMSPISKFPHHHPKIVTNINYIYFCEFNLIPVAIFPSMLIFSGLIFNFFLDFDSKFLIL